MLYSVIYTGTMSIITYHTDTKPIDHIEITEPTQCRHILEDIAQHALSLASTLQPADEDTIELPASMRKYSKYYNDVESTTVVTTVDSHQTTLDATRHTGHNSISWNVFIDQPLPQPTTLAQVCTLVQAEQPDYATASWQSRNADGSDRHIMVFASPSSVRINLLRHTGSDTQRLPIDDPQAIIDEVFGK